jgi:hypothetical protein
MDVSGWLHATAALPKKKISPVPIRLGDCMEPRDLYFGTEFNSEDGSIRLLRNNCTFKTNAANFSENDAINIMTSHPRR